MQESVEGFSSMDVGASVIPWSSATNWIVARGSLEASIAVESSDCAIPESDLETPQSPLVLKPDGSDSGPCEITINFEQKFEIGQIYVRSTARVYEIYYAHSSLRGNEYLCTVRCGAAERDGKILQTTRTEDVVGHKDCSSDELNEETVAGGGTPSNGEDDWVKIKAPEVARRSLLEKITSDTAENIQDLYEATAQINDAEPCSSLTIRLLSLQDKGNVYVDEIYVFVDPVESADSGNEMASAGNSAQNSLMAMFAPALLQLSKSGASRVQDKHGSNEVLKADTAENMPEKINQTEFHEKQVQLEYEVSKKLDKSASESAEPPQSPTENKCAELVNNYTLPARNIESTLEQLVSRVSRVEDIFLRFEEKLLRPIESIEARLQRVELQLEKLAQSSLNSGLPHGTRISAPAFSSSESDLSSIYKDQDDYPICGPSEIEKKDRSCHSMLEVPQSEDMKFQPSIVVSAPELTYVEDEVDSDDATPTEDFPKKKALSVDDALAEALHGFLSSCIQTTSGCSTEVDNKNQHEELTELHETEDQEFLVADGGSMHYTQVLTVKAPDFNADEIGNEELKCSKNEEKGYDDEISSTYSCDFHKSGSDHDFELDTNDKSSANGNLKGNPEDGSSDANSNCMPTVTNNDASSDLETGFVESDGPQICDSRNPRNTNEECKKDAIMIPYALEGSPSCSSLDFEFPILDVKFTCDVSKDPDSPLEALLYGFEAPSVHDRDAFDADCNETTNFRPLLVDLDVSKEASNMENDDTHVLCSPPIDVSLI